MRNLLTSILFTVLSFNTIFSQTVTAFSHVDNSTFEMLVPDTLYVVNGIRTEDGSNKFIEEGEYLGIGVEILFATKPGFCRKFYETHNQTYFQKRIDLETTTEVFFAENYTQDFDLDGESMLVRLTERQVQTKFKTITLFDVKKIQLVFLDLYGHQISPEEYYNNKFIVRKMVKYFKQ